MKQRLLAFALAFLLAGSAGYTQEPGGASIKVTTTLHDDGSRTDMQTNMETRTAESTTYNAAKKVIQRATFSLDDQGRAVDAIILNPKGQVISRIGYQYDAMGHVSEQVDKAADGSVLRRLVYHYDANGRVRGIDAFDGQGNPLKANSSSASTPTSRKKPRSGSR